MQRQRRFQLRDYLFTRPENLTDDQVTDYLWLLEHFLQEVRQLQVERRPARPLAPFTRP